MKEELNVVRYPLYKGCTRVPTFMGIPTMALIVSFSMIGFIQLIVGNMFIWFSMIPVLIVMRIITAFDDRKFRIINLWIETKMRSRKKSLWDASSYSHRNQRKIK